MSKTKQAVVEALTKIYEEAEPGLEFEHIQANPDEYPDDWYQNHFLPAERQTEIIEEMSNKYELSNKENAALSITVTLNYGPRGYKKEI